MTTDRDVSRCARCECVVAVTPTTEGFGVPDLPSCRCVGHRHSEAR